jgi:NAD(P)-dependent dehydrogenase (short-subunit alcohol dehydrogenase family)
MAILITGTTGIAAATAALARDRGLDVFLAGLPGFDLTRPADAQAAVEACLRQHGTIDALFNAAGASGRAHGDGPLHDCSPEGWRFTLDSNLTTAFLTSRAVLPHMLARRSGAILHMTSVLATHPEPGRFATHAYAAAKGALIALTTSMAAYYAPHGVRVNALAPGLVRTPMTARAQSDPAILEAMQTRQPLAGGMLDAAEIARAALFLLTDESRMVTGQVLTVDGGWSVR